MTIAGAFSFSFSGGIRHRDGINGIDPNTMNDDVGNSPRRQQTRSGTTPGRCGKD